MKYAWITKHRDSFPIALMCHILDVSRSGYYDSVARPTSKRTERTKKIRESIRLVFDESHAIYGSVKIAQALAQRGGVGIGLPQHGRASNAGIGLKKQGSQAIQADHHQERSDEEARGEYAGSRLHG